LKTICVFSFPLIMFNVANAQDKKDADCEEDIRSIKEYKNRKAFE